MTEEQQREFEAMRWLLTRMSAEIILMHPNPAKKIADLKSESEQLTLSDNPNIKGDVGLHWVQMMIQVGMLLDETESLVNELTGV